MNDQPPAVEQARPRRRRKAAAAAGSASPAAAGPVVELPAELGIEQAASLRETLAEQIAQEAPIVLAGAAVARVHGAGLQLLALFCRERQAAGRAVVWREPSPTLVAAAELLGLNPLMQIPRNPP